MTVMQPPIDWSEIVKKRAVRVVAMSHMADEELILQNELHLNTQD